MQLVKQAQSLFHQLEYALEVLSPGQYTQPSNLLFKASVGQHTRHIIELFLELNKGYVSGTVNYENRKRDHRIETDQIFAIGKLKDILVDLDKADRSLLLETAYEVNSVAVIVIATNYYREVIYNLEHTVHHMALIRVGVNEVSGIILPAEFGVASSTLKFRKACAQ